MGARIKELAPWEREDFVEVEGYWFFKINQTPKRSMKTASSIRYVPLYPELIEESLLSFVLSIKIERLFDKDGDGAIQRWFRNPKGANVQREGVALSHGWRHLFEDICIGDGDGDSAKRYITGRAKGSSGEDYGETLVRIPGLARELAKIIPFKAANP
ncbi:hypothetical protein JHL21_11345 [Devosia sp. WQ 349]|uniref:hypothetical protein n=1 Tax=Devosia sp. WQ 349K1 TaxID=2800329 RepID=UPI0019071943|nr:hypothetical protein [Devosia sp. WQ 349K1]MBK1795093.1 hypothetical protein [Devosia sp. WQ 349K1]